VSVAFCDSFDQPASNPATRSGDLNSVIWGVSRAGTMINQGGQSFNDWYPSTIVGCGANKIVSAPRDVQICNGRLQTAVADHEGQPVLAMYPKQPLDIAGGRTGTVVFDVSNDSGSQHGAWPEFWWTDQPIPAPNGGDIPMQETYARNSLGISFSLQCAGGQVGVNLMWATRSYANSTLPFSGGACVTKGSATGALNHFELKISQTRVEVWGTDAGSTTLKLMATAANANLTMTRGVIWVEHVHYNAGKFDNQADHPFAFDNIGFDGPKPYRDLAFDVADNTVAHNGGTRLGWQLNGTPIALQTVPVYRLQTPTSAVVTFNSIVMSWPTNSEVPSVRLNGGAWHDTAWPYSGGAGSWRTFAITVPVSEVRDGVNTVEFKTGGTAQVLSNVNVILIAGSPVP
jgi:hypothetical protein